MTPTQQFAIQLLIQVGIVIGIVMQYNTKYQELKSRVLELERANERLKKENRDLEQRLNVIQQEYHATLIEQARGRHRF